MSQPQTPVSVLTAGTNSSAWLTAKRLRAHATIVALCLWSVYLWNLSTPGLRDRSGNLKGTDFLHFYTLGALADAQRGSDLYDMDAQAALAAQRVPPARGLKYLPLYPPQVSILFAPLAHLSYGWALAVWWMLSAAVYATCVFAVWRACPKFRGYGLTVLLLAAGFPAFFHLIAWGQASALALACLTGAFFLLRERRKFLAGLVLGCLIFKPQLGLAAAVVFLAIGAWKVIAGAMISVFAQLAAGVLYYGAAPFGRWIAVIVNVRALMPWLEPKPYQTHCLRSFWSMLIPSAGLALALYAISAIAVLWWTIALWRQQREAPLALRYCSLLLATVLIAPHLTVYDLVILAPVLLLISDWLSAQWAQRGVRILGPLLYFVYLLPLLGPLTRWTHVQLSVIAMAACVYMIWRVSPDSPVATATPVSAEKVHS